MGKLLFTLAMPQFHPGHRAWVDRVRAAHDLDTSRQIGPHFTLAFGTAALDSAAYLAHVNAVSRNFGAVQFQCRRVVIGTDDKDDQGYIFLVPDEGNSTFYALHDLLYSGSLAAELRLDIPYIPHLTLGRTSSIAQAKAICDQLNREGVAISGFIDRLTVVSSAGGKIAIIAESPLRLLAFPAGGSS